MTALIPYYAYRLGTKLTIKMYTKLAQGEHNIEKYKLRGNQGQSW